MAATRTARTAPKTSALALIAQALSELAFDDLNAALEAQNAQARMDDLTARLAQMKAARQ